jgi:membrane protease YdiL (CAAX protease family)
MTSPNEPRTASLYHAPPIVVDPAIAVVLVIAAVATYVLLAITLPRAFGFVVAQLALAAVALGVVGYGRRNLAETRRAVGLGGARLRWFAAAIAIGATAWYLNMRLVAVLPIPQQQVRVLAALVDGPSLWVSLAMFAVLPAVCEEIVFRGLLARALASQLPVGTAVAISAVVFSAYHLSLVQAVPTLTLGALLSMLAIRADSVLPSIAAHALNNAAAIAMSRGEPAALASWLVDHPAIALAGAATACTAGLAIAWRSPITTSDRPRDIIA